LLLSSLLGCGAEPVAGSGSEESEDGGRPNSSDGLVDDSGGSSSGAASSEGGSDEGGDSGSGSGESETGSLPPSPGSFELGWGETSFSALEQNGTIELVLGPQGLWMFPMPIRAEGFELPAGGFDFDDPDTPRLTMTFDIEDYETLFGDYFARFNNLPLDFAVLENDTYEFIYLPVIAPNDFVDICTIVGHNARVEAELAVAGGGAPLSWTIDLSILPPVGMDPGCD
jgi:hypothetical protein